MKKVLLSRRIVGDGRYTFISQIEEGYVIPQNTHSIEFIEGTIDNHSLEVDLNELVIILPHTDEVLVYDKDYDFVEL